VRRGAVFLLAAALTAAPALAQTPPTAPTKPTVVTPVAPKPPVVQRAKPAEPAKAAALRDELKAVDLEIGKLQPRGSGKDPISQLNQQDMAYLQGLMTKKGELEKLISDTMKAASDTGQAIAANQKGS
jgi:hypothetical protein